MSDWNPNSNAHKARHGGYRSKPTRASVKANLAFWEMLTPDGYKNNTMNLIVATPGKGEPRLGTPVGTQLKLNF